MRSVPCSHARGIEVLAIVFFSAAHLAYSATPLPEAAAKAEKAAEAAPPLLPLRWLRQPSKMCPHQSPRPPRKRRRPILDRPVAGGADPGRAATARPPRKVHRHWRATSPRSPLPAPRSPAPPGRPKKAEKLRFQFRFQPWKDVLDWFAQQADLSLVIRMTIAPGHVQLQRHPRVHAGRSHRPAEQRSCDQGLHARAPRSDVDAHQHRRRHSGQPGVDSAAWNRWTAKASPNW